MESDSYADPKKFKVNNEKPNLDPFEKLFDVHHLIYQHLTGKEILKISEVSPAWYSDIGRSSVCMKKIKFNFFLKKSSPIADPTKFHVTKRHHSNVVVLFEHAGLTLLNRSEVIDRFANSVTNLEIRALSNLKWKTVCLPKLKTLRFELWTNYKSKSVVSSSFLDVIGKCNVENLIVNEALPKEIIFDLITKRLNSLKMLSLNGYNTKLLFGNDKIATLHQLKLTKLEIANFQDQQNHSSSISLFLKSQADTLENLVICYAFNEILKTAFELPKLKIFETASNWPNTSTEWLALSTSNSIVDLRLSGYDRLEPNDLQKLLERLPNLKHMTFGKLNIDQIRIISQTAKKFFRPSGVSRTVICGPHLHQVMKNRFSGTTFLMMMTAKKLETLYIKFEFNSIKEQYEAIKQNSDIIAYHPMQLKRAPFHF